MSSTLMQIAPWVRDVALAYVGGLVLGAPVAVLVTWLTGVERLTTWCLLAAMGVLLWTLRQQRARRRAHDASHVDAGGTRAIARPAA